MEELKQDLIYGLRMLLKQRSFALIAIITLALGIGANTAIFTVVNGVLLRPLPYKDSQQIVKLWETFQPSGYGTVSVPNLKDWREQNSVFTKIAVYQMGNFSLPGQQHPERIAGAYVSPELFDVMGISPQIGRGIQDGEDQAGNNRVVVLSHQLWQRNFAANAKIVGKNIILDGENHTVIGIMPASFRFPTRTTEVWLPLVFSAPGSANRGSHAYFAIGRMKPSVTLAQAQEQMSTIARRLEQQYPNEQAGRNISLILLQEEMVKNVRPALLVLLAAVGFVLLIACTNVANLLLARATTRRKEIAIRAALGAGRFRLIRQFLTESVLLALLGGVLGLLLAQWGVDLLVALADSYLPRANEISLDGRVLIFSLSISVLTGILFGLAPSLMVTKTDLNIALKEGGRAINAGGRNWLRSMLVVIEVAAALVLLIGAGLLIKSFIHLQNTEAGIRPENVLTARITLPDAKYKPATAVNFYQQLLEKVTNMPGVQAAGVINLLPLQRSGYNGDFEIEGQGPYQPGQSPLAEFRTASQNYFTAMGIPLVAGRAFGREDQAESAPVAIINQTLAKHFLANQDPIGKRIRAGGDSWVTIVGVVGDVKQSGLTQAVMPEVFVPVTQAASASFTQSMTLVVRANTDAASLTQAIRNAVLSIDPAQPIYSVQTMEEVINQSLSDRRLNMLMLSIFAGVALILAIIGIYSVMSYNVTQNTREIGIRMALGAQQRDVMKLIIGQGITLTLIGIGIGMAGALALMQLMASLLFGVGSTDPMTFLIVSCLLIFVAVLACYIPARRATRVDPMVALRYE